VRNEFDLMPGSWCAGYESEAWLMHATMTGSSIRKPSLYLLRLGQQFALAWLSISNEMSKPFF
jgi:hypothetical protein